MVVLVGDDVYGDDFIVNELQCYVVDLVGKEVVLFLFIGIQVNFVGLFSYCQCGEEYIVGQGVYNYLYEVGGVVVFGSIQLQLIDVVVDGLLLLDKVVVKIKFDDIYFVFICLLSLENIYNGKVLLCDYLQEVWVFICQCNLVLYVDGVCIFNVVVVYGCELCDIV